MTGKYGENQSPEVTGRADRRVRKSSIKRYTPYYTFRHITNIKCLDFDPEDEDASGGGGDSSSDNEDDVDSDDGREHYVNVGCVL